MTTLKLKYVTDNDPENELYICDACAASRVASDKIAYFHFDSADDYLPAFCGWCDDDVEPTTA
jgi:hypothetical protein